MRSVVRIRWPLTSPVSLPTGHDVAVCMSIVENAQFSVVRIGGDGQGPYFDCEPSHQIAGFSERGSEWPQSPPDDDAWR